MAARGTSSDNSTVRMSSDEEFEDVEPRKGASGSMALRIQKKLLGMTVKSKSAAQFLIDENSGELLDDLYDLAVLDTKDAKVAKKLMKDLIKVLVKLGLLYRKNQLNPEEHATGNKLRSKFKMAVLTMISYHDVAFTFDQEFLCTLLGQCKDLFKSIIRRHLTDKSLARVDNVFGFYGNGEVLTRLYNDEAYRPLLESINGHLVKMTDDGML
eukprot:m.480256 g.480256  ORF g.480256 m.480256 type:complete len:212 (-) comp21752_c0_seq1:1038-1673(-)